jgi:hypothetical protein
MPEGKAVQEGIRSKGHASGHQPWTATGQAAQSVFYTFGMTEVALLIMALVLQTCLAGDEDCVGTSTFHGKWLMLYPSTLPGMRHLERERAALNWSLTGTLWRLLPVPGM